MKPLLSYTEVIENNYIGANAGVVISPATQSLIIAALNILNNGFVWSDYSTSQDDIEAALAEAQNEIMTTEIPPPMQGLQSRITFWHRWAQISSGNALQIVVDATQMFNHYVRQNTAASTDETYQDVWLPPGGYEIRLLYFRAVVNGKISVVFQHAETLDQVAPISVVDLSGATQANSVQTASFTLTETGLYRVYWIVSGAGASTGGFFLPIICTEVWRTSD